MSLRPDIPGAVTAIVGWLDDAGAEALLDAVEAGNEAAARACIEGAGMQVPAGFDLADPTWRNPLLRDLRARVEEEEADEDAATTLMPNYAQFAADLRDETDDG